MAEQYANNAATTLNGTITSGATSLVVLSAANFPLTGNFRILVDSGANLEYMLVTSITGGGTTFNVTRGVEGTTAVSHTSGVQVVHMLTAGGLANLLASPARLLAYDANDLVAYRLNESVGTTFVNGGSAGAGGNLTINNNIKLAAASGFGPAAYLLGGVNSGTRDYTTGGAGIAPTTAVTLSAWIYILNPLQASNPTLYNGGFNWNIIQKTYRPVGSWAAPFNSFGIVGFNSTPGGQWWVAVTTGTTGSGISNTITASVKNYLRLYEWNHVGMTWDSATNMLIMYLNGAQIESPLTTSGALDLNAGTGYYLIGGSPDPGANECPNAMILDVRVATIARPATYFATAYQTGLRLQPG